jgi:hypothetical protein
MIDKLRTIGLACAAVLALSAVFAATAIATPQFTGSSYPTGLTGSSFRGSLVLTTEAGKVECDSHFLSQFYFSADSTLELAPTFTNCMAFGFLSATVNPEFCDLVLHATEMAAPGVYRHHFDVDCNGGDSIKITASTCKAEIKDQNGLTTVKTSNLVNGSITVQPEVSGIAYTVTQDGFLCPFGGTGNKTDGTYTGDVVLSRFGGGWAGVSGS